MESSVAVTVFLGLAWCFVCVWILTRVADFIRVVINTGHAWYSASVHLAGLHGSPVFSGRQCTTKREAKQAAAEAALADAALQTSPMPPMRERRSGTLCSNHSNSLTGSLGHSRGHNCSFAQHHPHIVHLIIHAALSEVVSSCVSLFLRVLCTESETRVQPQFRRGSGAATWIRRRVAQPCFPHDKSSGRHHGEEGVQSDPKALGLHKRV